MRYGINQPITEAACVPTMKTLKMRLKQQEDAMEDFIQITAIVDMSWESRQQTIGNIYMNIRDSKAEIHKLKQRKTLKVKKGK